MIARIAPFRAAVASHVSDALITLQETGSIPATLLAALAPPLVKALRRIDLDALNRRIAR